eukprot:2067588-Heterocapsa_arctica.AAC.1
MPVKWLRPEGFNPKTVKHHLLGPACPTKDSHGIGNNFAGRPRSHTRILQWLGNPTVRRARFLVRWVSRTGGDYLAPGEVPRFPNNQRGGAKATPIRSTTTRTDQSRSGPPRVLP